MIIRAASPIQIPGSPVQTTPEAIQIAMLEKQRRRFFWLTCLMIGVSFVHLAAALILFSGPSLVDQASSVGMILGLELFTAALAVIIAEFRRAGQPVSCAVWVTFIATLLISFGLNTSYLWSHRPSPDQVPDLLAKAIAVVFGGFIPLSIYTGATIGGSVDRIQSTIRLHAAERAMELDRKAMEQEQRRMDRAARRPVGSDGAPVPIPAGAATLPAPSANNGVFSLDGLLQSAGLTRDNALSMMDRYGLDTPAKAYSKLHAFGKLPDGLDRATFDGLWSELQSTKNPRTGNGKSTIRPDDAPAILAALRVAGITSFKWQKELCAPCDWSSETSAGKAVKALLNAGAIRQTTKGYEVIG